MRRELLLTNLDDVVSECQRLIRSDYRMHGRWTLGQICQHLRLTIDASIEGYPTWMTILGFPLRPVLRRFALPQLLAGRSPSGIRTAGMFVPPRGLDDDREVRALIECVSRFKHVENGLHAHPGFGRLNRAEFERFHAAHASHHLGFLSCNN